MALVIADRVQELSTTNGLVTMVLGGASQEYITFDAGVGVGNTCYYAITHSDTSLNEWEVGVGTVATSTTLTRDTVLSSSNAAAKVNFSAGAKIVFVTLPASRAVYLDAAGNPPYDTNNESIGITIALS